MKKIICGLDEAGRGPLAGPVTAGCVVLPEQFPFEILNDSKKLSPKKREYAERVIKECACWGLGVVDEKTIDKINMLQASLLAMKLAYEAMMKKLPAWCTEQGCASTFAAEEISAIADGTFCPDVGCECRCEIKADGTYHEVMAASIIAKVERDRIMVAYDKLYPQFGYAQHKGYPTAAHVKVCREIGPSPIQRLTFKF